MKLRTIIAFLLAAVSLSVYADNTTNENNTSSSLNLVNAQNTNNLTTAAQNGSAMLNTKNKSSTSVTPASSGSNSNNTLTLSTDTDHISYSIGYDIGRNFKNQNVGLNPQAVEQGIADGLAGNPGLMSQKDMQTTLLNFQNQLLSNRQAQLTKISADNKKASIDFLANNKTKPGIVTTADGLQYQIIKDGHGNSPTDKDLVTVNYQGSLPNGEVFDSSYSRGKPVTFPVSEVIQGWSEALKMMKPGSVWEVFVPPALAYGDRGVGPIGPNQVLVFKIELLEVNAPNAGNNPTTPSPQNTTTTSLSTTTSSQ